MKTIIDFFREQDWVWVGAQVLLLCVWVLAAIGAFTVAYFVFGLPPLGAVAAALILAVVLRYAGEAIERKFFEGWED